MSETTQEWFTATDGRAIFYRATLPESPKGIVLLVHGLHEHSGRYQHVFDALAARGFAVYAPDHRGHGRTAQLLGFFESMDDILSDLGTLHRIAEHAHPGLKTMILGHSMGGLISTLYCERTPEIAAAVLNGVAVDIPDDTSALILKMAPILSKLAPRLAVEPFYAPEKLCSDPATLADVAADPLYYKGKLRARVGNELLVSIRSAIGGLTQLSQPLLVTHGANDQVVPSRASEKLYGGAASDDKTLHIFEGLKHEVHNEPSRDAVLTMWLDWLEQRL